MDYIKNSDDEKEPEKNSNEESYTLPVIEEFVRVDKKTVETGKVRLIKSVTEHDVDIDTPLLKDIVEVERTAVNQYIESPPSVYYEGETMVIPVVKEVLVKRLMLVEEIRVSRKVVESHDQQTITLRKESVIVEREAEGRKPDKKK